MFNSISSEVRNLLLVASELGGEVTQYVKVLRKEKERLLPINEAQGEMEELVAERNQAVASEENMFSALMKANDSKYAERRKVGTLKEQLEQAQKQINLLEVTNGEYKEQLAKYAEELELMQSNRVHAEVYQKVAAERDRALAELRTQERLHQAEVGALNKATQAHADTCRTLTTQRDDALTTAGKEKARREAVEADLSASLTLRDNQSAQLRGWFQFFEKAIMATGTSIEELERTCCNREDLLEAIHALQGRIADVKANLETTRKERDRYGDEVLLLRRERDDSRKVINSVEIGEKAARRELGEVTTKYEMVQAKLLKIEALVNGPQSAIRTVARKAADGLSCHNMPQVVADAVASFIRTPIRHELKS